MSKTTDVMDALGTNYMEPGTKLDVGYFCDQPNAHCARKALEFLTDGVNQIELVKEHSREEIKRMWLSTIRACITYDVPMPHEVLHYGQVLGVTLPEV